MLGKTVWLKQDRGSRIGETGSGKQDQGSRIKEARSGKQDPGSEIQEAGSRKLLDAHLNLWTPYVHSLSLGSGKQCRGSRIGGNGPWRQESFLLSKKKGEKKAN